MQLLVLRPDYHSSSELEKLQKQLYLSRSKRALQPPHIPLLAYKNTSPLQLKAAIEQLVPTIGCPVFSTNDIGFSKAEGRFYLLVNPNHSLTELYQSLQLSSQQYLADSPPATVWMPHIPLIDGVQAPFWGPLFARLALEAPPLKGTLAAVECWSVVNDRTTIEWSLFFDS
jgi:hypothetical protein